MEVLEWTFSATASSDGPGAVYVFLAGSETDDGKQASYCTLYMESPEYPAISDLADQKEVQP